MFSVEELIEGVVTRQDQYDEWKERGEGGLGEEVELLREKSFFAESGILELSKRYTAEEEKVRRLRKDMDELRSEYAGIVNQEITIKRYKEYIKKIENEMKEREDEIKRNVEIQFQDRIDFLTEQNSDFQRLYFEILNDLKNKEIVDNKIEKKIEKKIEMNNWHELNNERIIGNENLLEDYKLENIQLKFKVENCKNDILDLRQLYNEEKLERERLEREKEDLEREKEELKIEPECESSVDDGHVVQSILKNVLVNVNDIDSNHMTSNELGNAIIMEIEKLIKDDVECDNCITLFMNYKFNNLYNDLTKLRNENSILKEKKNEEMVKEQKVASEDDSNENVSKVLKNQRDFYRDKCHVLEKENSNLLNDIFKLSQSTGRSLLKNTTTSKVRSRHYSPFIILLIAYFIILHFIILISRM